MKSSLPFKSVQYYEYTMSTNNLILFCRRHNFAFIFLLIDNRNNGISDEGFSINQGLNVGSEPQLELGNIFEP